ncbi:hypothetical protein CONCODRAFT_19833 [Conidiobolus coronatus NRRL 28638]|uniref:F-box domain-containing protein n=1 Tax=Conidiobolus coronatus (strain ATCC 28846 / CBS 209.66 / NRRL 28638) TaxID=796925 RepID=A0A137NWH7_CONC2|nr:hypothetical protein CONCODRAFT_19833 [Conidiobolus coronatus NRRL 28638]|eukprot:KXN67136.1 hypothetical protein CONCODRAFT_19833 [Conidiobolus coronatus NRRL 28638]
MNEEITDWNNILYYKGIESYLNFNDSIELSICNSKLRDKLYYDKFKPFQVREYLKKENYRTFEVEVEGKQHTYESPFHPIKQETQESVDQFEIELKTLNPTVETLIIYDLYDYLYGYKIADRFVNITSLNLNLCKISREVFQYMLNNLRLTKLYIKSTTIIGEEFRSTGVRMPQSLKKIEFIDVKHEHTNIYSSYIRFNSKQRISGQNYKLYAEHIENLKTLYYRGRSFGELTEFILMNPQLKSIILHQYELSSEELIALININQIEHLDSEYSINPLPKAVLIYLKV